MGVVGYLLHLESRFRLDKTLADICVKAATRSIITGFGCVGLRFRGSLCVCAGLGFGTFY